MQQNQVTIILKYKNEQKEMIFSPQNYDELKQYFLEVFDEKSKKKVAFYFKKQNNQKIFLQDFKNVMGEISQEKNPIIYISDSDENDTFLQNNEENDTLKNETPKNQLLSQVDKVKQMNPPIAINNKYINNPSYDYSFNQNISQENPYQKEETQRIENPYTQKIENPYKKDNSQKIENPYKKDKSHPIENPYKKDKSHQIENPYKKDHSQTNENDNKNEDDLIEDEKMKDMKIKALSDEVELLKSNNKSLIINTTINNSNDDYENKIKKLNDNMNEI